MRRLEKIEEMERRSWVSSRLHRALAELGQSVWIDSLSRELAQERRARADDERGRRRRRHVEPDHLPEGDRRRATSYDDQLREVIERGRRPQGDLPRSSPRRHRGRLRPASAPVWDGGRGNGRLRLDRGRPDLAYDTAGDDRPRRCASTTGRPAEPLREDPGDEAGPARDRGDDRARPHINVTLIFSLERHAEVAEAYIRARAARRGRRRSVHGRLGRELLRLAGRHRGRQAARRGRRPRRAEGQARDREREARLPELQGDLLRASAGRRSPRRARRRSAASGPRPRRRTPSTATSCTSRS